MAAEIDDDLIHVTYDLDLNSPGMGGHPAIETSTVEPVA